MKKIISVILIVCCMLTVCSCSAIKNKFGKKNENSPIAPFETAAANTNASNVIVDIEKETELGKLTSKLEVNFANDGSASIVYTYEKFNLIGEGAEDETKSTVTCNIVRAADGTYSGDMPEGLDLSAVSAAPALKLESVKDAAVVNEKGDTLTVAVPADVSAAVYGSALSYDSELEIFIKNGAVSLMEITFEGGKITYQYA
ncbi:MAG: hypothetical protein IJD79_01250 [Clostridia bacterium]|nr:hypothetical protein [Clostridia bacterium]